MSEKSTEKAGAGLVEEKVLLEAFRTWQNALVEGATVQSKDSYFQADMNLFFRFSDHGKHKVANVVTFASNPEFQPAIVKINLPTDLNKTDGLSHVLRAGDKLNIVRQGRLSHNATNSRNILPDQFEAAAEIDPIYQSRQNGKQGRNWFSVCEISASKEAMRTETSQFVQLCQDVRSVWADADKYNDRPRRLPWIADELILALDYYLRFEGSPPNQHSLLTIELSGLLKALGTLMGRQVTNPYRSPSSVYMKAMNFRRLDPKFSSGGTWGLAKGAGSEIAIWKKYSTNPDELAHIAKSIRDAIVSGEAFDLTTSDDDQDPAEATEGRVLVGLHRRKERSRKIVAKKIAQVLGKTNCLRCEACDMSFDEKYGDHGKHFIEVHHLFPVKNMLPGHKTTLDQLALLCGNCHRMVHVKHPWLTIEQLKEKIIS